ncbi:MAG: RluA family pseudouridine synthase [Rubripirellula sp.]|nr:RluA family pseudouridine synthase [Rubripirellula sp.]
MNSSLQQRNELLRRRITPLPGSQPYENIRPIRIPGRLDRWDLIDCVCEQHPHVSRQTWCDWFSQGHIRKRGVPADPMTLVRGGEEFEHAFPDTVEPEVNAQVVIAAEDENLIVIEKPAPLPIHPSGRFERNTLISFLRLVYPKERLKLVHRLDANTSGLVLIARNAEVAAIMAKQFESSVVRKRYLVRCYGVPEWNEFSCDVPISSRRREGGTRDVDPIDGKQARTEFRVIKFLDDNTTLLEAKPITGRTNQIRIHLWSIGHPVLGDPSYLPEKKIAAWQTLGIDDPPMCLHAAGLTVFDPVSGDELHWTSSVPGWGGDSPG